MLLSTVLLFLINTDIYIHFRFKIYTLCTNWAQGEESCYKRLAVKRKKKIFQCVIRGTGLDLKRKFGFHKFIKVFQVYHVLIFCWNSSPFTLGDIFVTIIYNKNSNWSLVNLLSWNMKVLYHGRYCSFVHNKLLFKLFQDYFIYLQGF